MTDPDSSTNQTKGTINKCPSCGGVLKAFSSRCDLCGYELTGVSASKTVTNLVQRFSEIEAELVGAGITGSRLEKELVARKARVIREFPIPNAREDLQSLIYFIHPKIQDNIKPDPNAEDWRVKFKEVLNLAKNAYKGDARIRAEFEEVERSLNVPLSGVLQTRVKRSPLLAIGVVAVALLIVAGIASTQIDKWKLKQCEEKYTRGAASEKSRLDGVVADAAAKQRDKKYADAMTVLNNLHWDYLETCQADEASQAKANWEEKRKELVAIVQKAASDDKAQQQEAAQREANEKRDAAVREQADKLAERVRQMSAARKAATRKEW